MTIIVDSDGLIGSIDSTDLHYTNASKITTQLYNQNAKLIYPITVIAESVTFLQGRLNKPKLAEAVIEMVNSNELVIKDISTEVLHKACRLMDFRTSKHNTLFDCIVAAVAEEYKADAIFSFDKFYKTKGFKLASEL